MSETVNSWPETGFPEPETDCFMRASHHMRSGTDHQCKIDLNPCSKCGDPYLKIETYMYGRKPPVPVRFKKLHEGAVLPRYAKQGDSGMDLTATTVKRVVEGGIVYYEYGTGLAVEIPEGYEGQIRPRSSISDKDLILTNSPGTIDSGYRGEIRARLKLIPSRTAVIYNIYRKGDRFAQLIIAPVAHVAPVWADELSDTDRGVGGYGSTDRKPCPTCFETMGHNVNCSSRWTDEE